MYITCNGRCYSCNALSANTNSILLRFAHYAAFHDVQMLAMLACVCQLQCVRVDNYFKAHQPAQDKHPTTPMPSTPALSRKLVRGGVSVALSI